MNKPIAALLLLSIAAAAFYLNGARGGPGTMVCFGDACVDVEVADNEISRERGLMFRESLPGDGGMLFVHGEEDAHRFWMKNTLIPLDIVWMDSRLRVVHIETAAPCGGDPCRIYDPGAPSKYVVEVNAGYAGEHGIRVGDAATIRPPL
jgi:uncharacterized protein